MKLERRYILDLKKSQLETPTSTNSKSIGVNDLPNHKRAKSVRNSVQISRIKKYKQAAANSVWYQDLMAELIQRDIDSKPLVQYLNGKSIITQ